MRGVYRILYVDPVRVEGYEDDDPPFKYVTPGDALHSIRAYSAVVHPDVDQNSKWFRQVLLPRLEPSGPGVIAPGRDDANAC